MLIFQYKTSFTSLNFGLNKHNNISTMTEQTLYILKVILKKELL